MFLDNIILNCFLIVASISLGLIYPVFFIQARRENKSKKLMEEARKQEIARSEM